MLFGRQAERAAIGQLLAEARASRSGVLVLRGEPGVGKTALLKDAREQAGDMHVLTARGIESESELAFAALHQLIRPALSHLDRLPAPQAAALRSAVGLETGAGQERFLVFAACLSLLSELAEHRPVVCLVDDAHWLDTASADALLFVARRLDAEGIVLLFGAREGDEREFEAPDLPTLTLTGLDPSDAAELLEGRTAGVAPSVRDLLVARTRGNALALVELPSALTAAQLAGEEPLPEALPLTRQLENVFLVRVRRLPEQTRLMLLIAAADDSEELRVITRAGVELGAGADALGPAERAELVTVTGARLEFRHPLIRSAVYAAATSGTRRAVHRALADALEGEGEHEARRAWHLAASTLEYDHEVVRALDHAAERAEERAGHVAAARAFERAAELSDDPTARTRRLVRAVSNFSRAGRDDRALELADRVGPLLDCPSHLAEIAHVRELAAVRGGRPGDVVPVLVEAARAVAPAEPAAAIQLLVDAADAVWQGGDRAGYLAITAMAATIPAPPGDEASARFKSSLAGFAAMISGEREHGACLLQETVPWGARVLEPRHVIWASFAAQWLGDEEQWDALVARAAALARERGELGILADALGMRAGQLAMRHRFDDAAVAATEAVELARELRAVNLEFYPRAALAIVAAIRGKEEEARTEAGAVLQLATANGLRLRASMAVYALALVDLGHGRWDDALAQLDSLLEGASSSLDPFAGPIFPDKIEAAVRASRPDEARAALPVFEAWIGHSVAPSSQARLAACKALLVEGDEAAEHFDEALRLAVDARPFDVARIQLLHGEFLRRGRQRTAARKTLRASLETFERLRAAPWAERARAELRASGETARKRDPSTVDQLTPQELQIARFVAEGLSNKEVAAKLFLSPRTIDAHLRNVFAKLGVTSRTQLARIAAIAGAIFALAT